MMHNPAARVIVMLRYPVDAAQSLFTSAWNWGHEDVATFEDAWRLQAERLAGRSIPREWREPLTLQYGAIYSYAEQVQRLFALVPRSQCKIMLYEEFFASPQAHFAETIEFLGLQPDHAAESSFFNPNPSLGTRSARLHRLLRAPPSWLRSLHRPVRPLLHALGLDLGRVRKLNLVERDKHPLSPTFRQELDAYFADDISRLEVLLGRELWRERAPR